MNAKATTRNVETLRNVLVDELVRIYLVNVENSGAEVLMELFREEEALQRVARRIGITFPPPARLAGLVLERRYRSS